MTTPILTVAQAAELLHCAPCTVEERLREGSLPGVKFGAVWVLPVDALLARVNELAEVDAAKLRGERKPAPKAVAVDGKRNRRALPALVRVGA